MDNEAALLSIIMFICACGVLLCGFPVALSLGGSALLFGLLALGLGHFDPSFFFFIPQRIFGTMTNDVLLAVPLFVFMGVMLERSKVAEELLETMGKLFGRLRGGLGIAVCIVGALLAASTGIVGATVVTMGLLSLPTMLKRGYNTELSCGVICASGTLGQIIPPSIVLVLLGDQISNAYTDAQREAGNWSPEPVSVGDLFAGALLPGLMLVGMYILYVMIVAIVRPKAAPAIVDAEDADDPKFWGNVFHAFVPPIVLIVAVLGSILAGVATPTEAAAVGAVGSLMLAGIRLDESHGWPIYLSALSLVLMLVLSSTFDLRINRDVIPGTDMAAVVAAAGACLVLIWGIIVCLSRTYRQGILVDVNRATLKVSSMVFVILIGAALFGLVFKGLGGDQYVKDMLHSLPGGVWGGILVVMLVMFVLGFFLDFIEIVFVVVPIVAPALFLLDPEMSPVWLGVLMAMNLQTSFLTPPFGFALFYLRGVAPPEVTTMHIYRGIIPFVLIQIGALGMLAMFPQLATWLPKIVFG
ncbi:TRAP dicarboxylate transporter, DctM subunit [alpha proteobacterium BAL199]|jgi:tripartite ATP-independent transporter DctM subunit|nr:TRAP dicarboxylate transporter, DctM subunit [alpha proteobacterium BAL199]